MLLVVIQPSFLINSCGVTCSSSLLSVRYLLMISAAVSRHLTEHYSTVQYMNVQYSTVQYMIVQYSTATLHLSELLTFPRTSRTNLL